MRRQIQIAAGNDAGRSKIASIASLTNLYAEVQRNTSGNIAVSLLPAPGSRKLFTIDGDLQITAFHETASRLFFTTRKGLYEITLGNKYVRRAEMAIVGRASIADNGQNLVIVDGFNAYSYSLAGGLLETIDLPGCYSVRFIDGYFLATVRGTNTQRCSNYYSTLFPADRYATCEGSPDNIQAVARLQRIAYFLNQKSIEPWYNTGNDYPFDLNESAFSDRGCYTPWSYCETDETIYWLGDDKTVYAMNGFTPKAISGHAEEYELSKLDCSGAYMETYSSEGHDFVLLQIPNTKKTLCYDAATGLWHNRETNGSRHFSNCMITVGGVTYAGASDSASVYIMDSNLGSDDGQPMLRKMVTPPDMHIGRISSAELLLQYFNPPAPTKLWIDMTAAERKLHKQWPEINMSFTDDDGTTWSADDAIPLEPNSEMRAVWRGLGFSRRRSYMFWMREDMPCAWVGVWLT